MKENGRPNTYEALIRVIHDRFEQMSKSYQEIATYLTQNPNDVAVISAHAIAEKCGVHPSSFVRFAQYLGYDGFKELQAVFQRRLSTAAPGFDARIKALEVELGAREDRSETSFLRDLVVRDISSLQDLLTGTTGRDPRRRRPRRRCRTGRISRQAEPARPRPHVRRQEHWHRRSGHAGGASPARRTQPQDVRVHATGTH